MLTVRELRFMARKMYEVVDDGEDEEAIWGGCQHPNGLLPG